MVWCGLMHHRFEGSISLERAELKDVRDTSTHQNTFEIISPISTLTLVCRTEKKKKMWMNDLSKAIEELKKKNQYLIEDLNFFQNLPPKETLKIIKEGYLFKQGGIFKHWNKRWFVLEDGNLYYYPTKPVLCDPIIYDSFRNLPLLQRELT